MHWKNYKRFEKTRARRTALKYKVECSGRKRDAARVSVSRY